jgi:hypothetical protein
MDEKSDERHLPRSRCDESGNADVTLNINTDGNITTLNNLYQALENITRPLGVELYSVGKCKGATGEAMFE